MGCRENGPVGKWLVRERNSAKRLFGEKGFGEMASAKWVSAKWVDTVLSKKFQRLCITGNPGIGKTFFGYYLLYLLALQNATIVYDNFHETRPIIFEGGKAFISDKNGIERYVRRLDVWYIVDGKEPKEVKAKTILVCSPRKNHYWGFTKYDGVVTARFMPTWS